MLVVNCRSLKNKVGGLAGSINFLCADVIIGTESWLAETVLIIKYFLLPSLFRAMIDQLMAVVFLFLVNDSFYSCKLLVDNNSTESVLCLVTKSDWFSFVVGAFYRPPASDLNGMRQLRTHVLHFFY